MAVSGCTRLCRPAWIYEGALLFVTVISCRYRDSPYKGDWRGRIAEGPRLSRPARREAEVRGAERRALPAGGEASGGRVGDRPSGDVSMSDDDGIVKGAASAGHGWLSFIYARGNDTHEWSPATPDPAYPRMGSQKGATLGKMGAPRWVLPDAGRSGPHEWRRMPQQRTPSATRRWRGTGSKKKKPSRTLRPTLNLSRLKNSRISSEDGQVEFRTSGSMTHLICRITRVMAPCYNST